MYLSFHLVLEIHQPTQFAVVCTREDGQIKATLTKDLSSEGIICTFYVFYHEEPAVTLASARRVVENVTGLRANARLVDIFREQAKCLSLSAAVHASLERDAGLPGGSYILPSSNLSELLQFQTLQLHNDKSSIPLEQTSNRNRMFECRFCRFNRAFEEYSELQAHESLHNGVLKEPKCVECRRPFGKWTGLRTHNNRSHAKACAAT